MSAILLEHTIHLDLFKEQWLLDHCPTYAVPTMPFMSILDTMAQTVAKARPELVIIKIENVNLYGFCDATKPCDLNCMIESTDNDLIVKAKLYLLESGKKKLLAVGTFHLALSYPQAPPFDLPEFLGKSHDPYVSGMLFHGITFQLVTQQKMGIGQSISHLRTSVDTAPAGYFNQVLLDATLHGIPHSELNSWSSTISQDLLALPMAVPLMEIYAPKPQTESVIVHSAFGGYYKNNPQYVYFNITVLAAGSIWLRYQIVEYTFNKTAIGVTPEKRKEFVLKLRYLPNTSLSTIANDKAMLNISVVKQANWLAGSVERIYDVSGSIEEMTRQIAMKELLAAKLKVHPREIDAIGWQHARLHNMPAMLYSFEVERQGDQFIVSLPKSGQG